MTGFLYHEAIHVLVLHDNLTAILSGDSNIPPYCNGKPDALQMSSESWTGIVQTLDKVLKDIKGKVLFLQKIILMGFIINTATIAIMTAMENLQKYVLIVIFATVWMGLFLLVDSVAHNILHTRLTVLLPRIVEGYNVGIKTKSTWLGSISYLDFTEASYTDNRNT